MSSAHTTKPIRFGIQLADALPGMSWADSAKAVEAAGFSSLSIPDHFGDQLGPMTALAVAGAVTTELRVGALVYCNDYRHPVVFAKELTTLDVLTDGRCEWGIGAGWMRTDYEQSGMPYDRPGVRIERLAESVDVIRSCLAGEQFSFSGEHYEITDYVGLPAPVQQPGPPLLIGGGGPRMLAYAAENADIVGINPNLKAGEIGPDAVLDALPDAVEQKIEWVRDAAGERFDQIELNTMCITTLTDDRDETLNGIAALFGADPDLVASAPLILVGATSQMADTLLERRERFGFSYFIINDCTDVEALAPLVQQLTGS